MTPTSVSRFMICEALVPSLGMVAQPEKNVYFLVVT